MNVLEIPEVARLHERMLAVLKIVAETPDPEPGFLGLSHRKMRRTAARIRAGKFSIPAGDMTTEQILEAMERTIHWEETMKWVRAEIADIIQQVEAIQDSAAKRAMDHLMNVFHTARQLAKEKGPDSDIAKSVEIMERAWRADFPRARKKRKSA
jgi:hypothetical protein